MTADALDRDDESGGSGHGWSAHHAELPDRHSRPVMDGEGALDGKPLEHAVVDHRLRPGAAFLRRLEAEDQRAVEFPVLGEPRAAPSSIVVWPS